LISAPPPAASSAAPVPSYESGCVGVCQCVNSEGLITMGLRSSSEGLITMGLRSSSEGLITMGLRGKVSEMGRVGQNLIYTPFMTVYLGVGL